MLFAAGWTVDDVLDLSWQQIALVVSCVLSFKIEQANVVSEAVSAALGGTVERKGTKRRRPNRTKQAEQNERALLAQFAQHGFDV